MSSFLYLLDTNIISYLVRHPVGQVYQRIKKVGEEKVCTSIIVAVELRYGIRKKGSERREKRSPYKRWNKDIFRFNPG